MHYLAKEHWSPRYDSTFFTIQLSGKELLHQSPTIPVEIVGKANFPAVYFRIDVFSEHKAIICMRRYSHFKWLHNQLMASPPDAASHEEHALILPPGSCPWQKQNDEFLQNRLEALQDYMGEVLARPGYARHDAIQLFLELDKLNP